MLSIFTTGLGIAASGAAVGAPLVLTAALRSHPDAIVYRKTIIEAYLSLLREQGFR
jgi:hypothetical protein